MQIRPLNQKDLEFPSKFGRLAHDIDLNESYSIYFGGPFILIYWSR